MTQEKNLCPICGGQVTQEERMGHFNMGVQAHGHLYKAFCEVCQITLERKVYGDTDSGWLSSSVDKDDIIAELSPEEIIQIEKMLTRYPKLRNRWQEFIAQKQETDKVYRFREDNLPYSGLTIKRGKHLIGKFIVTKDL